MLVAVELRDGRLDQVAFRVELRQKRGVIGRSRVASVCGHENEAVAIGTNWMELVADIVELPE